MQHTFFEPVVHKTDRHAYSKHHISYSASDAAPLYAHWHDELEFFYLKKGTLTFFVNDERYILKEGEALFLPERLFHYAMNEVGEAGEFHAFVFDAKEISLTNEGAFHSYIEPLFLAPLNPIYINSETEAGKKLLSFLNQLFAETHELAITGYLLLLWKEFFEHFLTPVSQTTSYSKIKEQIQPALLMIQTQYAAPLTIEKLAACANLSVGQFIRSFKKYMHVTPFVYLNHYRIMESCVLLQTTDLSISTIAFSCGFNNLSYYNREFKKLLKITPSVYRKTAT